MSFEKKGHEECHHIEKCSFKPIAKSDPIRDLNYISSQQTSLISNLNNRVDILDTNVTNLQGDITILQSDIDTLKSDIAYLQSIIFTPSYATFWDVTYPVVNPNEAFPFNNTAFNTNDITLDSDKKTITIGTSGLYQISYKVLIDADDLDNQYVVGISVDGTSSVISQSLIDFYISQDLFDRFAYTLDHNFQLFINAGSELQLKNLWSTTINALNHMQTSVLINILRVA